jgi:hypothetical protein
MSFYFRCDKFLEEMFGCETSLVDIILNSLLADTSSVPRKGAERLGGSEEGHINSVNRVPRHHCDKSQKGTGIHAAFITNTHTRSAHSILFAEGRVADLHHFNAFPNPAFHFTADPDPTFHFNADPKRNTAPH